MVLLDDPSPFRDMIIKTLDAAGIAWRLAYVASTLSAVRAAVKAGLGVTGRPAEMMSPDLRALGKGEGMPDLPETEYMLSYNVASENELAQMIFQSQEQRYEPWPNGGSYTPEGGDNSLIHERDLD